MSSNQHICDDNCKKGGKKNSVPCFLCKKDCYLRCFGIDSRSMPKLNDNNSFLKFICGVCQAKVTRNGNIDSVSATNKPLTQARKSSGAGTSYQAIKTADNKRLSTDNHQLIDIVNKLNNAIAELSTKMTPGNCFAGNTTNANMNDNGIIANDVDFSAECKFEALHKTLDRINSKVDLLTCNNNDSDKIKDVLMENSLSLKQSFEEFINERLIRVENLFEVNRCKSKYMNEMANNSLDVSAQGFTNTFSALNSPRGSQAEISPDLYQLWHNFDSHTWSAFDNLSNLLKDNISTTDWIKSRMLNENSSDGLQPSGTRSALVESIQNELSLKDQINHLHENVSSVKDHIDYRFSSLSKSFMRPETETEQSGDVDKSIVQLQRRLNRLRCPPTATEPLTDTSSTDCNTAIFQQSGQLLTQLDGKMEGNNTQIITELLNVPSASTLLSSGGNPNIMGNVLSVVRPESSNDTNRSSDIRIASNDGGNPFDMANTTPSVERPEPIHSIQDNSSSNMLSSGVIAGANSKKYTRELYLTKFKTHISVDNIKSYLTDKNIVGDFRISRLIRQNEDITKYSFVSFKIDTTNEIAEIITNKSFWPHNCTIKNFVRKNKLDTVQNHRNFTRESTGSMPT